MLLLVKALKAGTCGILAACSAVAGAGQPNAQKAPGSEELLQVTFDITRECNLTRDCKGRSDINNLRLRTMPSEEGAAIVIERFPAKVTSAHRLRPEWAYQFSTGGPSLEVAALGAGREDAPSLIHLALGWDF